MEYLSIKEASQWASAHTGMTVTTSNIAYLVQYGRIKRIGAGSGAQVAKSELRDYYNSRRGDRAVAWQEKLGADLNWTLSFQECKEADTTKHVHRLHPYKGKFIPQLVAYFLDDHTDAFKTEACFRPGDIVLDPFSGSGTTMVQANELGMHCIGADISAFNALIGNAKVARYDAPDVKRAIDGITTLLRAAHIKSPARYFDEEATAALKTFNQRCFPSPDYRGWLRQKTVDEAAYGAEKELEFRATYDSLRERHGVVLTQDRADSFLDKWFSAPVRAQIDLAHGAVEKIANEQTRQLLRIVLSRVIRSCRATTHADLGTLVQPVHHSYYCAKHGKICKPLFSIFKWWCMYSQDTLKRIAQFNRLRTDTQQVCLTGDSRGMDLPAALAAADENLHQIFTRQKIRGIFSSPPYVGLIDYHEQHAYAYDLFGWPRRDESEIGAMRRGQSKAAQAAYARGVSDVLNHCKQYLAHDYHVFLVANDKYGLYPAIADNAGMTIVKEYLRPVLNRTEKDKRAYSESIFHLREK